MKAIADATQECSRSVGSRDKGLTDEIDHRIAPVETTPPWKTRPVTKGGKCRSSAHVFPHPKALTPQRGDGLGRRAKPNLLATPHGPDRTSCDRLRTHHRLHRTCDAAPGCRAHGF